MSSSVVTDSWHGIGGINGRKEGNKELFTISVYYAKTAYLHKL